MKKTSQKGKKQKELNREKILFASLEEFAKNGYILASTNIISKNANISKGLIFHYFQSKKNLYLECARFVIESLKEYVETEYLQEDGCFFEIFYQSILKKFDFIKENPLTSKFLAETFSSSVIKEVPEIIELYYENRRFSFNKLYSRFDSSLIRDGIDEYKAFEFIFNVMTLFSDNYFKDTKGDYVLDYERFDSYISEMRIIENFIKYGVYKM